VGPDRTTAASVGMLVVVLVLVLVLVLVRPCGRTR
jgi:hypothetical protein